MERPGAFADLVDLSARIGVDPMLVQAAGGNTSLKNGDVMWIKASGTLLGRARDEDIFVAVDLPAMRASLAAGDARSDRPAEFAIGEGALRPSIETSLHAAFAHRVVVHVHCVNTIALAIRADAATLLAERLQGFAWVFVPYAKPGAVLARKVRDLLKPATDVVVLGNHGLIVAADTVADAADLLGRVVDALQVRPDPSGDPAMSELASIGGDAYRPCEAGDPAHQIALSATRTAAATGGSLYPDHVIFCGVGATVLEDGETVEACVARVVAAGRPPPPFLLVPGKGTLLRSDHSSGTKALTRCLGDVLLRIPKDAELVYLTDAQNAELLDWDAEKYRQAMNAR